MTFPLLRAALRHPLVAFCAWQARRYREKAADLSCSCSPERAKEAAYYRDLSRAWERMMRV
jgi:hypothetical protein